MNYISNWDGQWLKPRVNVLYRGKDISDNGHYISSEARPDFAELEVFLCQHILLTLEQLFNSKM